MKQAKGSRIVAFLIDLIGTTGANYVVKDWLPSYSLGSFDLWGQNFDMTINLALLIIPLYFLIFDLFNHGRTVGKIIMGIAVVDIRTQIAPGPPRLMVRTLLKCVSIAFWPISLLVFVLFSVSLHDSVAGTMTLKVK